jgi:ABC-type branched-subunit amino acid transport system substrate-binding protein
LDIGGQKYMIEFVNDDNKMDEALTKTAAIKEINQDGVKFIITDMWGQSIYPVVEQAKVVTLNSSSGTEVFNPKWHYLWQGVTNHTDFPSVIMYVAKKIPALKTIVLIFPDREDGHGFGIMHKKAAEAAGLTVLDTLYYPATATDLSAIGTKIAQLKPDAISAHGGGPQTDSMTFKAAYQAGWRGQVIGPATIPGQTVIGIAGAEPVEGMISIGWPAEFEPATTELGKWFKAAYKAKFGKWDDPEIVQANEWWILKTALQKAGSIDPEKVKAVLDNGMEYVSINGSGKMINRPDQGNDRTVNTVIGDLPVKQLVKGQVVRIDTLSMADEMGFMKQLYGSK